MKPAIAHTTPPATLLALAAAALIGMASTPAQAGQHFTVVERPTDEKTIDIGDKGDSPGDLLVFANPIFDAPNKTQVATDQGYCVRITPGKSWECMWTNIFKDGMITVEGPFSDVLPDSTFVVTGGTGKYAGAKGSMKLHWRDDKGTTYNFTFDLQ